MSTIPSRSRSVAFSGAATILRHQIGQFLWVYIDDLLIASPVEHTHLEHLRIVFSNLRAANLKLHPSICCSAAIPRSQSSTHPAYKLTRRKRLSWKIHRSTSLKEVRSFLGLATAILVEPLGLDPLRMVLRKLHLCLYHSGLVQPPRLPVSFVPILHISGRTVSK